jgi:FkbM family methyltransferase
MPYRLNKRISWLLHTYRYRLPYFRGKSRTFRWLRSLMGYPWLTMPYDNGGWILLDEREYIDNIICYDGYYEPEVWLSIKPYLDHDEVFWDIGANIGSGAISAVRDARVAEVHCFEPNPIIYERLKLNLDMNGSTHTIHQIALSDKSTVLPLFIGWPNSSGTYSLAQNRGRGSIEVRCMTIDTIIKSGIAPIPTIMKIDVEGWEEHVLRGGEHLLSTSSPKAIVFEAACNSSGVIDNANLTSLLLDFHYRIEWIRRPSGRIDPVENFIAYLE